MAVARPAAAVSTRCSGGSSAALEGAPGWRDAGCMPAWRCASTGAALRRFGGGGLLAGVSLACTSKGCTSSAGRSKGQGATWRPCTTAMHASRRHCRRFEKYGSLSSSLRTILDAPPEVDMDEYQQRARVQVWGAAACLNACTAVHACVAWHAPCVRACGCMATCMPVSAVHCPLGMRRCCRCSPVL